MAEIWPKNGHRKGRKKIRDETPISIDYTAHFARKWSKMALNSRRNETINGVSKTKSTLGPNWHPYRGEIKPFLRL
jgi:hypothetical protein